MFGSGLDKETMEDLMDEIFHADEDEFEVLAYCIHNEEKYKNISIEQIEYIFDWYGEDENDIESLIHYYD